MTTQHNTREEFSRISVEVVFASELEYKIVQLNLPINSTARQAVEQSGLSSNFPDFEFTSAPIGVFGSKVPDDYVLADNDRVEIYRPLTQSARDARRQRAKAATNQSKRR